MDQLNFSANFTNNSSYGYPPTLSWNSEALVCAVLLSLCFLMGFPGNLAVIILKPNWGNLSKVTQSLMMNLAVSDLLCLGTLPFWIYTLLFSWTLGTVTCKIVGYVTYCSVECSLLTVTALSVQRYVQVIHQQRCLQFKKRLPVLLWLSSMVLAIPALLIRKPRYIKYAQKMTCGIIYSSSVQQVAVLFSECIVGFGSFTVTTVVYIFLKRKLNQAVFFNNISTSRLVTCIIVTFFVLWMPYFIFNLVCVGGILNKNQRIIQFYYFGFTSVASVTFINSCINPLLYAFALKICHKSTNVTSNNGELTTVTDL